MSFRIAVFCKQVFEEEAEEKQKNLEKFVGNKERKRIENILVCN